MRKLSGLKQMLLACWIKLAVFLEWVEKHPLIDKIVLRIIKIVIRILTRK